MNGISDDETRPILIKPALSNNPILLQAEFETNPIDKDCLYRVQVISQSLEIKYHAVNNQKFFFMWGQGYREKKISFELGKVVKSCSPWE